MNWKDNFKRGKEIILATCGNNQPNANIVESLGFVEGKLLIKDAQMDLTLRNLKENKKICIIGGYIRLKGNVEIFDKGRYFEMCRQGDSNYPPKNAILVIIKEIFNLDKLELINF